MDNLTDKQRRFCEEYVVDWNATQAAIRAGYSEKTAKETGYENLTKPHVESYINECKEKVAELAGISALQNARWLKEIAESKEEDSRVRIKAIEVLNKMKGYDAAQKIDHTTQGDKLTPQIVINLPPKINDPVRSEDDISDPI